MANDRQCKALLAKAHSCYENESWEQAVRHYKYYLSFRPDDGKAWVQLGIAQWRKDPTRTIEIKTAFENASRLLPEDPSTMVKYANVLWGLGDYDLARHYYLMAIEFGRKLSFPYWSYAHFVHAVDKDVLAATHLYNQAYKAEPDDSFAMFYLGHFLIEGDPSRGIKLIEQSARMNNKEAIEFLNRWSGWKQQFRKVE